MKNRKTIASAPTYNITNQPLPTTNPILDIPSKKVPATDLAKNYQAIKAQMKDTGVLDIRSCNPDPVVVQVHANKKLVIKNSDTIDHVVVLDKDSKYTIPAKGQSEVGISFQKGLGPYGYGCDTLPTTVGYFFLTE